MGSSEKGMVVEVFADYHYLCVGRRSPETAQGLRAVAGWRFIIHSING